MSFTSPPSRQFRLNRSELAVPASSTKMIEKAVGLDADVIFLDLEDAVAPGEKEAARSNVVRAVNDLDWGSKSVSYRINGLDTHFMYRDLIDVYEACGEKLDLVMVPKVGCASDVYAVDMLLTQIEDAKGFGKKVGLELLIETALGIQNISEIAKSSRRIESLHFGAGDYAASVQAKTTHIGGGNPDYAMLGEPNENGEQVLHPGDPYHHALASIAVAARANGLRPIDSAYGDFSDPEGYKAAAKRAAALGCEGKWAIHPSQIELANAVMGPDPQEVSRARKILEALEEAGNSGAGAVTFEGRMIDAANIRQAEHLVAKADMLKNRL